MNLDQSISELLFTHECVIIPGFGGFVTNYRPAEVHPTQHTFTPPSRSIVFNKNLKNNDGLLANHLVATQQLSYQEALGKINEFAASSTSTLYTGKKLVLSNIGILFHDIEKNIQFQPDAAINYLLDSFGLCSIQSPAIKRDGFVTRLEKEPKDRDVLPAEVKRKLNIKRYVVLTLAAAVIFTGIWIPLRTDLLKGVNYANLNPFANKEKSVYTEKSFTAPLIKPLLSQPIQPIAPGIDTSNAQPLAAAKKDTTPVVVKLKQEAAAESTAVSTTVSEKVKNETVNVTTGEKYSIIGGCFAIPENADHYVAKLRTEGVDAFILKTNSSLRHVSYGSYASYAQAIEALAKARTTNKDAWMLIR